MDLNDLARKSGEWLRGSGPESDIVISSRVRLARNLADFPFISRASQQDRTDIELALRERRELDLAGVEDALGDGLDLLGDRGVERIERRERVRLLAGVHDRLRELRGARAAAAEAVVALGREGPRLEREAARPLEVQGIPKVATFSR